MNEIVSVSDVVGYIDERLEYLRNEKAQETAKIDDVTQPSAVRKAAQKRLALRIGMSNELVIIREMLKQIQGRQTNG